MKCTSHPGMAVVAAVIAFGGVGFAREPSRIYPAGSVERRALQARQRSVAACGLPLGTPHSQLFKPSRLPRVVRAWLSDTLLQH